MDVKCEKTNCRYYSTYTDTCDFTLINSRARPCPAKNCTEFVPRDERRTWQLFVQRKPIGIDDSHFILADCGHEVYSGERTYEDGNGVSLCPDCIEAVFHRLTTEQKAYAIGYEPSRAVE